jgi:hypothetical protein
MGEYVLIAWTPVLAFWLISRLRWLDDRFSDRLRRRLRWGEDGRATGPPIQRLVADLHRLRGQLAHPANPSYVSRCGVQAAYDTVLTELCLALDVPQFLTGLSGADRELERIRVEGTLARAGIRMPTAPPGRIHRRPAS